jgi:hypothetical protein
VGSAGSDVGGWVVVAGGSEVGGVVVAGGSDVGGVVGCAVGLGGGPGAGRVARGGSAGAGSCEAVGVGAGSVDCCDVAGVRGVDAFAGSMSGRGHRNTAATTAAAAATAPTVTRYDGDLPRGSGA